MLKYFVGHRLFQKSFIFSICPGLNWTFLNNRFAGYKVFSRKMLVSFEIQNFWMMKKPISTEKNYPAFHRRIEIAFSNLPNVLVLVVVVLRYPIRVESTTSLVQKHFILFETNHKRPSRTVSYPVQSLEAKYRQSVRCTSEITEKAFERYFDQQAQCR